MPPISLGYVAAAIEKAGLPIAVYDDFLLQGSDSGLYGPSPDYYEQNLILFSEGWLQNRYLFTTTGHLDLLWRRK